MTKRKLLPLAASMAAAALLLSGCTAGGTGTAAPTAAQTVPAQTETAQPAATAKKQTGERTSATGFYFDTVVTLTFYDADDTLARDLQTACARYENLLSKTREGSDVWRINHAQGERVQVDAETWSILKRAKEISQLTSGRFSVTIAPLTAMWDFTGGTNRMPSDEERIAALPLVDDTKLVLEDDNYVTLPAGMQIDLGGIAKGYIADKAAEMASGRCSGATLNFGGNVYVVGHKPDGSAFRLGITNPLDPSADILGVMEGTDCTLVTSGTYERYFDLDGKRYHHILSPDTGLPAETDLLAVTITGTGSMDADAFATACIVLGREKAMELLTSMDMDAILVTTDGLVWLTPGFTDRHKFTLSGEFRFADTAAN